MGKDRRKEKADEDDSLGKKSDKFGKKGDGKMAPTQGPDKARARHRSSADGDRAHLRALTVGCIRSRVAQSFSHQECRHILVQKQSEALRIRDLIHDGKMSFNEAAFQFSEDKAGAHGLLGWKSQGEVRRGQRSALALRAHASRAALTLQRVGWPRLRSSTRTFGRRRSRARRATGCASRSRPSGAGT